MKSHFNSLTSTITFTLYALLPSFRPHVIEAYPVESTSQALQQLSVPSSSDGSMTQTPENSLLLEGARQSHVEEVESSSPTTSVSNTGVGESWASEFDGRPEAGQYVAGGSVTSETDDEVNPGSIDSSAYGL